jgi:hypothetical protein
VIGHLAWPLVLVVLLVLLRGHIGTLAERIEEFSFGGAKFTWRKKLEEGALIIEQAPPIKKFEHASKKESPEPPPIVSPADQARDGIANRYQQRRRLRDDQIRRTAIGGIIFGLAEVDELLYQIGDRMGADVADPLSVIHSLKANNQIPETIVSLYRTLRDAKNVIAHSPSGPTEAEAAEYLRQTAFLQGALANILDMTPMPTSDDLRR